MNFQEWATARRASRAAYNATMGCRFHAPESDLLLRWLHRGIVAVHGLHSERELATFLDWSTGRINQWGHYWTPDGRQEDTPLKCASRLGHSFSFAAAFSDVCELLRTADSPRSDHQARLEAAFKVFEALAAPLTTSARSGGKDDRCSDLD